MGNRSGRSADRPPFVWHFEDKMALQMVAPATQIDVPPNLQVQHCLRQDLPYSLLAFAGPFRLGGNHLESTSLLLAQWRENYSDSGNELIKRLYPELARIAAARLRGENNSSLSTGDLINEVVLRLIKADRLDIADRAHFIALSARLMRNILVDHVREKNASKRQHVKVELCTRVEGGDERFDLADLNAALIRLGVIDKQYLDLVEMRYFGGMTVADIAAVTGMSEPTVHRRWQVARAWLLDALTARIDYA
jgi:RNA polymerase sigma factor (TIGR02999 family)